MKRLARFAAPSVVVASVLLQFAPVLAGRVYRFEDIAGYFEPLWSAAARQVAAGHFPIWDRGAWSGQPIAGDPQAGLFYPLNWLWIVLPVLRAYAVTALLHALFGALGMYRLARLRGRSEAASAMAGIALGVGAFMVMQLRHVMFVEATAWVPWVTAAGWQWIETRDRRHLAKAAAATGMMLLTGGVSMIYFGAWFVAAVLIARLFAEPTGRRAGALFGLAVAALLGLALAAPMLAPMLAHARISPRALGADYHFASRFAWPNYGFVVTLFVPNVFGDQSIDTWKGGSAQWELAGYYAGIIPFALAVYWLVRGDHQRRGERAAMATLGLLAIGLSREGSLTHRIAYQVLPLLSATRCPARALYVYTFAVPLLGADGFDLLLARLPRSRRLPYSWIGVALVALDLLVAHRHWNPSQTLARATAAGRLEATAFLEAHRGDRFVNDVHLDHALHGSGLLWGLDNASGYSSLPIWRYLNYLWIANHGQPYPHARIHDDLSAQGIWRFSSPLVDGLAVRWVLTKLPPNGSGFQLRFHGQDGVDVWENLDALPRAWMVHKAQVVDGEAASARAIADPAFDPRDEVILEQAPSVPLDGGGFERVDTIAFPSPTESVITLHAERAAVLVMAEPAHPDWSALVDGKPAQLLIANHALRGLAITPGAHQIRLTMRRGAIDRGFVFGAAALLAILALALSQRRRPVKLLADGS